MTSNTILDAEVIRLDLQREQSNKIDGARLLFEVSEFLGRFIAYPNQDAQIAHTLWIAHTHMMSRGKLHPGWHSFHQNHRAVRPERWRFLSYWSRTR
jgi:hypothetical protein